jgi:hypothetical protein
MNLLTLLKTTISVQSKIKRKETENLLTNMDGISMMPRKSGASDPKPLDPTFLLIKLRPYNILMKLRIHAKLLSNGPLKKPS